MRTGMIIIYDYYPYYTHYYSPNAHQGISMAVLIVFVDWISHQCAPLCLSATVGCHWNFKRIASREVVYQSMAAHRQHRCERAKKFFGASRQRSGDVHSDLAMTSQFSHFPARKEMKERKRASAGERVGLIACILKQRILSIRRIASHFHEKITFTAGTWS